MDRARAVTCRGPEWQEARAVAHRCAAPLASERVDLHAAHGRITSEPVVALTPLPPTAISAMDGWAVAGVGPWRITGEVLAGSVWGSSLVSGQAVRIATGATIPQGATGVLRRELGIVDAAGLLEGEVIAGQDIRPAGEEAEAGAVLVRGGSPLTPARVGLLAAGGHDSVAVVRRPTARLLVLGDELLSIGAASGGRVRDSLGPQLPGWLERLGVDLLATIRVPDTLAGHVAALEQARAPDIVLTTGGTAAGPVDHLHAAITRTGGSLLVDGVACRPGHPMVLAGWSTGGRLVGLPGNPLAAIVALLTLGSPLVAGLCGQPLPDLPEVVLGDDVANRGSKTRLVPCRLAGGVAVPMAHIGSGMLRGLADADGLAVVGVGEGARGSFAAWLGLP